MHQAITCVAANGIQDTFNGGLGGDGNSHPPHDCPSTQAPYIMPWFHSGPCIVDCKQSVSRRHCIASTPHPHCELAEHGPAALSRSLQKHIVSHAWHTHSLGEPSLGTRGLEPNPSKYTHSTECHAHVHVPAGPALTADHLAALQVPNMPASQNMLHKQCLMHLHIPRLCMLMIQSQLMHYCLMKLHKQLPMAQLPCSCQT